MSVTIQTGNSVTLQSGNRVIITAPGPQGPPGSGGGSGANLAFTRTATTVTVTSDTGTDATLPAATALLAGVFTATEQSKLAGIETLADVTDAANVGAAIDGATAKTTPVDADTMPLIDSAASNTLKKVSWANIKATLKAYYDTLYAALVHTHVVSDITPLGHLKLIGRHGAGAGAAQEVGIDGGLEWQDSNIRRSALTGDVTVAAGGTTATIASGAVTADKMAATLDLSDKTLTLPSDVTRLGNSIDLTSEVTGDLPLANIVQASGASKLLGRGDSGAGDFQELTLGTNLSISGTTLNATGGSGGGDVTGPSSSVNNNVVMFDGTSGKIIKDSGLTLSGSNTGDQTNITGNAGTVTDIGNLTGVVTSVNRATTIADAALSIAKTSGLQTALDGKQSTGNYITALTGDVTASGPGSVSSTIANGAVTLTKMANLAPNQFIGRVTNSSGVPETATITPAARSVLDDASVDAMRATLEVPKGFTEKGADDGETLGGYAGAFYSNGGDANGVFLGGNGGAVILNGGDSDGSAMGGGSGNVELQAVGIYSGGSIIASSNGINDAGSLNLQAGGSIISGTGDINTGNTSGTLGTMAFEAASNYVETSDVIGIANGGTGQTTQTNAFDALSPTTTKGDLIVHNGTDNVRLAGGTDGHVLTRDSTTAEGVKWAAGGGGGGGKVAQVVYTRDDTAKSSSTQIPSDNTIPQNNEGTAYTELDTTITPTNASSTILVDVELACEYSSTTGQGTVACLFRDNDANALAVGLMLTSFSANGHRMNLQFSLQESAGSTSATTYKVRFGRAGNGGTSYLNAGPTALYGGAWSSSMVITEILP